MLRKLFVVILAFGTVLSFTYGATNMAEAKTKIVTFKNCKDMNKIYRGGVSRSSSVRNKGGKTHFKPYVSKALYDANKARDRDHDNIACER